MPFLFFIISSIKIDEIAIILNYPSIFCCVIVNFDHLVYFFFLRALFCNLPGPQAFSLHSLLIFLPANAVLRGQ
ncbi:hypothetical protein CIG23_14780 [Raoultella planticola]|nr:hypothetical protein CIG23_14780 [Raoultella planticola]